VISRAAVVVRDGTFVGPGGHGAFLRRDRADWVRKS
jgi:hypothetical protein